MKVNVQTSEQKSIFACLKNALHADRPVWVSTPENVLRRTEKTQFRHAISGVYSIRANA